MSPAMKKAKATGAGFPRVSGDEPCTCGVVMSRVGFSPRERG